MHWVQYCVYCGVGDTGQLRLNAICNTELWSEDWVYFYSQWWSVDLRSDSLKDWSLHISCQIEYLGSDWSLHAIATSYIHGDVYLLLVPEALLLSKSYWHTLRHLQFHLVLWLYWTVRRAHKLSKEWLYQVLKVVYLAFVCAACWLCISKFLTYVLDGMMPRFQYKRLQRISWWHTPGVLTANSDETPTEYPLVKVAGRTYLLSWHTTFVFSTNCLMSLCLHDRIALLCFSHLLDCVRVHHFAFVAVCKHQFHRSLIVLSLSACFEWGWSDDTNVLGDPPIVLSKTEL